MVVMTDQGLMDGLFYTFHGKAGYIPHIYGFGVVDWLVIYLLHVRSVW